ncbi:tetratricopeptide repeat protein [Tamlana haliotis]|uniref:Tetratricopeptide repeat protein n=1 Tax=Pseudotamlana haliotis TaxID=2614804 RepID=A0A6N6MR04_9FLAO|nr:tetratricopeptide repeat protein [Tamlana haliotis]KAB1071892.1 tetratricopeptide repeat protein [Tamlana haliotis]
MPKLFVQISTLLFILYTFTVQAQDLKEEHVDKNQLDNKTYENEITQAFSLLNGNKPNEAYRIAHKLLKKELDTLSRTNTNLLLGAYFNSKHLIDSSLYYSNQALKHSILIQNDSIKNRVHSIVYNLLAINNKRKGLLTESKKWHYRGFAISQKYKEDNLYYMHLHGLANINKELGDYQNAIKTFKKCLNYEDDAEIIYGSYINLGDIYASLKDYNTSNEFYQKALKLSERHRNFYALAVIKTSLAANYYSQNKIDEAIKLYNEAILLSKDKEYMQLALSARLDIGRIFYDIKQ